MPLATHTFLQDRYLLQERLGANGAKQTWLAQDKALDALVTVKALYFGQGMEWQDLKLFEREAATLEHLNHPRIPRYRDSFWVEQPEGNYFCLIQDYIPGISLTERIQQGKALTETEVERIAREVLEVLVHLHGQNPPVIHRDIKPSNLIWGTDEQIYVVDFGSVQAGAQQGRTITVVGTYGYMPPEQFGGRAVPASDLYGLGATLVYLMTATNPADLPQEHLRVQFRRQTQVSPRFGAWLERMLEPGLDRRWRHAAEALQALNQKCPSPLTFPKTPTLLGKPLGSRIQIERTDYTLEATIPAKGLSISALPDVGVLLPFVVFAGVWTILTVRGGPLFVLFSLPIWLVLLVSFGSKLWSMLGTTRLTLDREYFTLHWELAGFHYTHQGRTADLHSVRNKTALVINNEPQEVCLLQEGVREFPFALGLSGVECQWLVQELRSWLVK
ncbi:serine/threonine protein kinase [Anthocerotibacter panamensis]|uniref:serine/threonine protein kinase n=1 Tax=Anthocerotibacter panamensis TaxID=2857077 RepID=UPI001C401719|nr:serine/threonine-protein kinase [Anthocerotibacter panamensis]